MKNVFSGGKNYLYDKVKRRIRKYEDFSLIIFGQETAKSPCVSKQEIRISLHR